jgi:hypothetical protein
MVNKLRRRNNRLLGNCLAEAIAVQGAADVKDAGLEVESVTHTRRTTPATRRKRLTAWQITLTAMVIVGVSELRGTRCDVDFPSVRIHRGTCIAEDMSEREHWREGLYPTPPRHFPNAINAAK